MLQELFNHDIEPTPFTTTRAPRRRPRPPQRQSRPILDGLAWLWKTWQETAPAPRQRPLRQNNPVSVLQSEDEVEQDNSGVENF